MDGTELHDRQIRWTVKLAVVVLIIAGLGWKTWHDTMADPVVRRTTVFLPGLAPDTPPMTLALVSDVHVAGPNMSPERLARIVGQVNALHPDAVLLAGDYVSDPSPGVTPYPDKVAVAPFGKLRAPLGIYAVIGNHERLKHHSTVDDELTELGITVLVNEARKVGPLAIGGLDDPVGGHARLVPTLAAMHQRGGGLVLLSHGPDPFADLPPNTGLMLAGHTHCGQIAFFGWAPFTNSRYGERFACGIVRERGNTLVVTAGIGTSFIPVRFGAVPDVWLIQVRAR
jgi:predicted MPP superfamily phosphohydrolase